MASNIVYSEGWDLCTVATSIKNIPGLGWNATGNGNRCVVQTTQKRNGTRALRIDGTAAPGASAGENCIYAFPVSIANCIAQFAIYLDTLPTASILNAGISFYNSADTSYYGISFNNLGKLQIVRDGVVLATFPDTFTTGVWYPVALQMNNDGTWNAWVNGVIGDAADISGNSGSAFANVDHMRAGQLGNAGVTTGGIVWIDDFVIYSGTFLGDLAVFDLLPNADTALADWTPATGTSGFAMIDNVPVNLAEFIQAATVGFISDFACASPPVTIFGVYDVATVYKAEKTTAGAETVRGRIVQGVTVQNCATVSPPQASQNYFIEHFNTNPISAANWTPSDLSTGNTKIGFEKVA